MRNFNEMLQVLNSFDSDDYDVVEKLIPLIYSESVGEYNQNFNFFDFNKDDLKFIIADRIFWFLVDNATDWEEEIDIDIIVNLVYEHFER